MSRLTEQPLTGAHSAWRSRSGRALQLAALVLVIGALDQREVRAGERPPPVATTQSGKISGTTDGGVSRFLGIPYAAPPVGRLRWRAPEPVAPWKAVRPAIQFGKSCFQAAAMGSPENYSEDCLYLNVWTPAAGKRRSLPVMVWIHGGGYLTGSGALPHYDGTSLAEKGVVLVSINYRLHAFGYLAHPSIGGNFGLQDQIAALRWIHDNIARFGGDPDNVTVFGESAGADAASKLLSARSAQHLFSRAIIQSGGFDSPAGAKPGPTFATASEAATTLLRALGTPDFDAARQLPARQVWLAAEKISGIDLNNGPIATPSDLIYFPYVDPSLSPYDKGIVQRSTKPVLLGFNQNEARFFAPPGRTYAQSHLADLMARLSAQRSEQIQALLRAAAPESVYQQIDQLFTTLVFVEPALVFAGTLRDTGHAVYLYHFSRVSPGNLQSNLLASHGVEIPYVFGTLREEKVDATDRLVSREMQAAWVSFARNGRPVSESGKWPALTNSHPPLMTEIGDSLRFQPVIDTPLLREARTIRSMQPRPLEHVAH